MRRSAPRWAAALTAFPPPQDVSHKFVIAVLMEYIRSLNQFQIPVQVEPCCLSLHVSVRLYPSLPVSTCL